MARYLYLIPMLGGSDAPRFPLGEQRQLIGRTESADIPLFEPTVSRRHASIHISGGEAIIEDLSSKHGTYVNSRRIDRARLRVGDIIVIGLSLVLRLEESAEPLPLPDGPSRRLESSTTGHLDEHYITAVRDAEARRLESRLLSASADRGPRLRSSGSDDSAPDAEAAALCVGLLPEARGRLLELRQGLKALLDAGNALSDPYPFLSSVDSVLETVDAIIAASQRSPSSTPPAAELGRAVQRALGRLLEERPEMAFLVQIPAVCSIPVGRAALERALLLLLDHVERWTSEGSPVEVMAAPAHDHTVLSISYVCRTAADRGDEEEQRAAGLAEARDAVEKLGGTLDEERRTDGTTLLLTLPSTPP